MRLWRVFPSVEGGADVEGGPLWFPRMLQGDGRHDNPDLYGALYLSGDPAAAVVEVLAPFRGTGPLTPGLLRRGGRPLALAEVELDDSVAVLDLDDPRTLVAEGLRPSVVATRRRRITQAQAAALHAAHPDAGGLRWWSTFESTWPQVTVFDRAAASLAIIDAVSLDPGLPPVVEAAIVLGLA